MHAVPVVRDGEARYTLAEVAQHNAWDDCWIVVHDIVYDMTHHVVNHEGWTNGSKQTTLIAILSAMGCDCTEDFDEVHSEHAKMQLAAFRIGVLTAPNSGKRTVRYRTWEDLLVSGVVPEDGNPTSKAAPTSSPQSPRAPPLFCPHAFPSTAQGTEAEEAIPMPVDDNPTAVAATVDAVASFENLPPLMVQHILCAGGSARSVDALACVSQAMAQAVAESKVVWPIFPAPEQSPGLACSPNVVAWNAKTRSLRRTNSFGHALVTFDDVLETRDAVMLLDLRSLPAIGCVCIGLRGYRDRSRRHSPALMNVWNDGVGRAVTYTDTTGAHAPRRSALGERFREGDEAGIVFLASSRGRVAWSRAVGFVLNGRLVGHPIPLPPSCCCFRFVLRFDHVPGAEVRLVRSRTSPFDLQALLASASSFVPRPPPEGEGKLGVLVRTLGPDSRLYTLSDLDPATSTVAELAHRVADLLECEEAQHVYLTCDGRVLCQPGYHATSGQGAEEEDSDGKGSPTLREALADSYDGDHQLHDIHASLTHLIS